MLLLYQRNQSWIRALFRLFQRPIPGRLLILSIDSIPTLVMQCLCRVGFLCEGWSLRTAPCQSTSFLHSEVSDIRIARSDRRFCLGALYS
jgi:hypothetical protein